MWAFSSKTAHHRNITYQLSFKNPPIISKKGHISNCTKAVSSISISKNLKQFEKPDEFAKYEADSPYKEKKGLPGQLGYPLIIEVKNLNYKSSSFKSSLHTEVTFLLLLQKTSFDKMLAYMLT
ncbi:hypothetical protein [uncultured Treponema sp.]|uniref:hypothetical protein n=1 Tax=uncultured Treponema sp. TaxID=162155 RepID=UPI00258E3271|nr:hypothetical protein [uncultured Treponema sp.]